MSKSRPGLAYHLNGRPRRVPHVPRETLPLVQEDVDVKGDPVQGNYLIAERV